MLATPRWVLRTISMSHAGFCESLLSQLPLGLALVGHGADAIRPHYTPPRLTFLNSATALSFCSLYCVTITRNRHAPQQSPKMNRPCFRRVTFPTRPDAHFVRNVACSLTVASLISVPALSK